MRIHIVARKIRLTKAIKEFIEAKIRKLTEYSDNIIWAQTVVAVEKKTHIAEVIVHAGHQTMKASAVSEDLYSAIDMVMNKMEAQIKKYKDKTKDHRPASDIPEYSTYVAPGIRFSVVKDISIKPMNKEDAVVEMEKLGYNFWLFMEKSSKQMQVVFKRLDNTYGLLQPVKTK
jgi:putative sigma-54 modulation protein